jgi:A/G-specific adenine glycosylase
LTNLTTIPPVLMTEKNTDFAPRLLAWFDQFGRHDLPWQVKHDPYKVWVSEIMLQQTQVKTVLNYFDKFMARFPSVEVLAAATWDEVAPYWAGLGYYARARNLHKAAGQVIALGRFPHTLEEWMALSGIGRSTAGALMSLGLQQYGVIMDGNVKRVLSRHRMVEGDSMSSAVVAQLWQLAEQYTPHQRNADYTQAIMDLGATICTSKKPLCLYCPVNADCLALQHDRVTDFPQKKTKTATPIKQADVLLLQYQQKTLWVQRQSSGLWGGLWSLPLMENTTEFEQFKHRYALQGEQRLSTVKHVFTHFTWLLTTHIYPLNQAQFDEINQLFSTAQWIEIEQAARLGIPKAMLKIVELYAGQS